MVHNFFCRTTFYNNVYDNLKVDVESLFQRYCRAFTRNEISERILAPMLYVHFPKDVMDFGNFQIRKFGHEELNNIFSMRVNKVFYQEAVFDLGPLTNYWFLCLDQTKPCPSEDYLYDDIPPIVERTYPSFPVGLEQALKCLVLYDWNQSDKRREEKTKLWTGSSKKSISKNRIKEEIERSLSEDWLAEQFYIPFALQVEDDELFYPKPVKKVIEQQFGLDEGEQYLYTSSAYDDFVPFINEIRCLVDSLISDKFETIFVDIALGYAVKGYLSRNLDEFLSHIIVLEALFGERTSTTKTLKRRISNALGKNSEEVKRISSLVDKLYDFRSNTIHGNSIQQEITYMHLMEARDLARRCLVWFLKYLDLIAGNLSNQQFNTPLTRSILLLPLDYAKRDREDLGFLLKIFPSELDIIT